MESGAFGHEKGSFTGADSRRVGCVLRRALVARSFLTRWASLLLRLQAKLLDFIQYKRIVPIGANREIVVDVRIIAATNRDMAKAATRGEFPREDLYHRLKVFHIDMALRGDTLRIRSLSRSFLTRVCERLGHPCVAPSPPRNGSSSLIRGLAIFGSWKTPWSLHVVLSLQPSFGQRHCLAWYGRIQPSVRKPFRRNS